MAWRRRGVVLAGLLIAGWAWADPPAGSPAAAPAGHEADVTLGDGTKLERVRVTVPVLRIGADFGAIDLDPAKVKLVDLIPDSDGTVAAAVTLVDKHEFHGPLLNGEVTVVGPAGPQSLPAAGVSQVRYRHPRDTSLAAVLLGLLTLTLMEIVLGVDNVVLLSIYVGKLPPEQQQTARFAGLAGALLTRLLLLTTLSFLVGLTRPVVELPQGWFWWLGGREARGLSWRDFILLAGGAYLIWSSVKEVREKVETSRHHKADDGPGPPRRRVSFWATIVQLAIVDIVFSIDSVITAIGLVDELWVMVTAVIVSVGIMLAAAKPIGDFVNRRPTVKVLALSFLILIGALLVAEGLGQHLNKGYIYFAMAFAVGVELVNSKVR